MYVCLVPKAFANKSLRVLKSGIPKQRHLTSVSFTKRLHVHYIFFFGNEVSISMTATKIA